MQTRLKDRKKKQEGAKNQSQQIQRINKKSRESRQRRQIFNKNQNKKKQQKKKVQANLQIMQNQVYDVGVQGLTLLQKKKLTKKQRMCNKVDEKAGHREQLNILDQLDEEELPRKYRKRGEQIRQLVGTESNKKHKKCKKLGKSTQNDHQNQQKISKQHHETIKNQAEIQQKKQQNSEQVSLINWFICPICDNFIAPALQTSCGHCFCQICLHQYLLAYHQCPICEKSIRQKKLSKNKKMDQVIDQFVNNLDDRQKKNYNKRLQDAKIYREKLKVQNFEVGASVDIRDQNYLWHKGLITRKYTRLQQNARKVRLIDVQYMDIDKKEEVQPTSSKIAKPGTFTDRADIPKILSRQIYIDGISQNEEIRYNLSPRSVSNQIEQQAKSR